MSSNVGMNLTSRFMTKFSDDMEYMPYTKACFQYPKDRKDHEMSLFRDSGFNGVNNFLSRRFGICNEFNIFDPHNRSLGALIGRITKIASLSVSIPLNLLLNFAGEVKSHYVNHSNKYPLHMIPGSAVLGAGCYASVLADLVKDTALTALNLLGIAITLGVTARSDLFKRKFCRHLKNAGIDLTLALKLPLRIAADVGVNVLSGSASLVVKTAKLIPELYFAALDKTPLAKYYPDQV